MRYSYTIEKAIRAATVLHAGQVRRGRVPYPYITHIFATAMIVADYTDDEHAIIVALLHDTLHKTEYTRAELAKDFGTTVRDMVDAITEPIRDDEDPKAFLSAQKAYLKKLKDVPESSLIVLAASTMHTMRTMIEEYCDEPRAFSIEFGDDHDMQLFFFQEVSNALNRRVTNPILSEFNDVFTEYKHFIHDVKESTETP